MKITVLIPVKSLEKAKSRLKNNLTPKERKLLVIQMLEYVIRIVKNAKVESDIYIVTNDLSYKKVAALSLVKLLFINVQGLNRSLSKAVKQIPGDKPLLILSADLPFVTKHDIEQMVHLSKMHMLIIASSKEETGTNALFLKQPDSLPFLFGKKSLQKFINAAKERSIEANIYTSETIAFDVDTFSDYKKYQKIKS